MPGMIGLFGDLSRSVDTNFLLETINPIALCDVKTLLTDKGLLAVSWLRNESCLLSSRYYDDVRYSACLSGDIIDAQRVPWKNILSDFGKGYSDQLSKFRGTFAISIFDKSTQRISIISDRTSQQPVYYFVKNNMLLYSTSLPTFCRLPDRPEFNPTWLYEFLFFNYPIGQTTFLKNVFKMPPATILDFDLTTSKFSLNEYVAPFRRPNNLIKGRDGLERALQVFSERVPAYIEEGTQAAISLTGGLDSRTVLSMIYPKKNDLITTYTYGGENCNDLLEASMIASALKIPHLKLIFNKDFIAKLPSLIYDTVYLSNGLERVSRSTLPYVYKTLTNNGQNFPYVISGVSGDHLFRDHIAGTGNVPAIISSSMMQIFQNGKATNTTLFKKMLASGYDSFEQHINNVFAELQSKYGELNTPAAYLSYLIYEVSPHYFVGEATIANNYTVFRTPYWDADIIKLAYEIEYGTLGLCESSSEKDKYREVMLQMYLISKNAAVQKVSFNGIPIHLFLNKRRLYGVNRVVRRGYKKIVSTFQKISSDLLEDWKKWFEIVLDDEIHKLISDESLLSKYLSREFLQEVKTNRNPHWLGKVLTAEIILNLIKSRWRI